MPSILIVVATLRDTGKASVLLEQAKAEEAELSVLSLGDRLCLGKSSGGR